MYKNVNLFDSANTLSTGNTDFLDMQVLDTEKRDLPYRFYRWGMPFVLSLNAYRTDGPDSLVNSIFSPSGCHNATISDSTLLKFEGGSLPIRPMHYHDGYELCYVMSGNLHQTMSGANYYYPAGGVCLLPPNTLHTELLDHDYLAVFVSLSEEFADLLYALSRQSLYNQDQDMMHNSIMQFLRDHRGQTVTASKPFLDFIPKISASEQKKIIHDLFDKMILEMLSPTVGSTTTIMSLLLKLFSVLTDDRYYDYDIVSSGSKSSSLLFSRINQLLDEHDGRITNSELSRILNYNGTYISRIVKKQTGMSLFDYSMKFAMKKAASLLLQTELTVQEIMDKLNFTNRTHFNTLFREAYGMTPSEYRKKGTIRRV